jgi:Uma2 family endonuclease
MNRPPNLPRFTKTYRPAWAESSLPPLALSFGRERHRPLQTMSEPHRTLHRWTREEYDRMLDAGVLSEQARLELVDGEIVEMTPQKSAHSTGTALVVDALRQCFSAGYHVRSQMPLAIDDRSEPEPDAAVVEGGIRDYADHHPRAAVLVVEVADSTLSFDRMSKAAVYARSGVPEYWILNLRERTLEAHRCPSSSVYTERVTLTADQEVSPLAAPQQRIRVADLLP